MTLVGLAAELGERPARVLDVRAGILLCGGVGKEGFEVLDRLGELLTPQQYERESIVGARRRRRLLQHVAIRLRSLLDHSNTGVADRDLLKHDSVARRFLEGEPKRRECLMELAGSEEFHTLVVIVDRQGIFVAQNLVPKRHSRVG